MRVPVRWLAGISLVAVKVFFKWALVETSLDPSVRSDVSGFMGIGVEESVMAYPNAIFHKVRGSR